MSLFRRSIVLCTLLLCVGSMCKPASAQSFGVNLLVNGDAEANAIPDQTMGTEPGADVVPAGWTRTFGAFVAVTKHNAYWADFGPPFFPSPGPGITSNFFIAGHNSASAQMFQIVDVSAFASIIDLSLVLARIDARIGTFTSQTDGTILAAQYFDAANNLLGTLSTGEINNNIYNSPTVSLDLNLISPVSGIVPAGTRKVAFFVTGIRHVGSDDDSYVDDINFQLVPRIASVSTQVIGSHWEEVNNTAGERINWRLVQDVLITNTGNVPIQTLRLTSVIYGTDSGYVTVLIGGIAANVPISASHPLGVMLSSGVLTAGTTVTVSVPYLFPNSPNPPLPSGAHFPFRISGDFVDAQSGRPGSFSQSIRSVPAP
jgi:hypothetical protein